MRPSPSNNTPSDSGGVFASSPLKELQTVIADMRKNGNSLQRAVVRILDQEENPMEFIHLVCVHGCSSGVVSELILYRDTHRFYDRHYDDIENLRIDYEADYGHPMQISGDLKNALAWYAFEHVCHEILARLD